MLYICCSGC